MVGHASSTRPTGIVHAVVTLTRSKVKVKVTGFLNFRKLAKPCMLSAMTVSPLAGLCGYNHNMSIIALMTVMSSIFNFTIEIHGLGLRASGNLPVSYVPTGNLPVTYHQ